MTFVQQFKEEYKQEFMRTLAPQIKEKGRQEGRLEGRREGEHDIVLVIARRMFNTGKNRDYVKEMTGLSDQVLRCLEKNVLKTNQVVDRCCVESHLLGK